ncbi:TPA: DUF6904 family protein [Salmonella enterica]
MLRYELTPNNAGFVLWGDSAALDELHQLIHYIVEESPLIEIKDGFILSLAYDIRKAREGCRRTKPHQYEGQDTYQLYGVELLWPLVLLQTAILRRSMAYVQTDKKLLSVMYAFEYILESALADLSPESHGEIMKAARNASDSDAEWLESNIDSRCCYFITLPPEFRSQLLCKILCSMDAQWSKYTRDPQDNKMLRAINNTASDWPDDINW